MTDTFVAWNEEEGKRLVCVELSWVDGTHWTRMFCTVDAVCHVVTVKCLHSSVQCPFTLKLNSLFDCFAQTVPTLSIHFNSHCHCPGGRCLAGTRMFPSWILLELRMMEIMMTTGAVRHAKLQLNHHHQQTNTQFFTGRMPFLPPNQQCH